MSNREITEKIKKAFLHAVPDRMDEILSDCKVQEGRVFTMPNKKRNKNTMTQILAVAACLCLLIGGGFGFKSYQTNNRVDATVALDVNPSVEITVNKKERVLEVKPLNNDGKTIVGNMDFSGSDLDVTMNALVGSMLQNGYLNELANSILISVDNNDRTRGAALQKRLTNTVNRLLQTDKFKGAVLSQTVHENEALQKQAQKYGITLGKAQLIEKILSKSTVHTFKELSALSINELNLLLSKQTDKLSDIEIVGTASDKAYIGEARAKEIALKKASVTADGLKSYKIELDTEDGEMVYEVEFISENYEYECEINAATGTVVKFEKEYKGSQKSSSTSSSSPKGSSDNSAKKISAEKAKETAFKHAGVSAAEVTQLKVERDTDDGIAVYEIEFECGNYEYDYEIDASTGAVIQSKKEFEDEKRETSKPKSTNSKNTSGSILTAQKATEIALKHAGITSAKAVDLKAERDTDDGVSVYEVEFEYGNYEYDYKINAETGKIIKSARERED